MLINFHNFLNHSRTHFMSYLIAFKLLENICTLIFSIQFLKLISIENLNIKNIEYKKYMFK